MELPDDDSEESYEATTWIALGDLMTGLMLIFLVLCLAALLQANQSRIVIIKSVKDALDRNGIAVQLDPKTGDISITESLLFDQNSAELKPEGRAFLDRFIPVYATAIMSNPAVANEVTRLAVEGHTSLAGSDLHNMRLSLGRANAVTDYIYTMPVFEYKNGLLHKLTPMGRGRVDARQDQDDAGDRKVIFRFQFRGEFEQWQKATVSQSPDAQALR